MTRYNSKIRVHCKCSKDCPLLPSKNYNGYAYSHASEELKEEVKAKIGTKRQQYVRKRANKANLAKKLWIAQKKVGVPKNALKRQNKPIAKIGKKMLENLNIYRILRKDFLKDNPVCQCGRNGCKRKSQDVHHKKGRGIYLNVVEFWLAVARVCHTWINEHPKEAMRLGLTISRLSLPVDHIMTGQSPNYQNSENNKSKDTNNFAINWSNVFTKKVEDKIENSNNYKNNE